MSPALIALFPGFAAILVCLTDLLLLRRGPGRGKGRDTGKDGGRGKALAFRGVTGLALLALALALIVTLSNLPLALTGEAIRARTILPGGVVFVLRLDTLALIFLLPMLLAALAAALCAGGFFEREATVVQFQGLLLAAVAAVALVILADQVWLAALSWMLAALFAFLMLWRCGEQPGGMVAALPGLLVALFAGGFLFTGLSHLASLAGSSGITRITHRGQEIAASGQHLMPAFLILAGALAGAGLVPFRIGRSRAIFAPAPVVAFLLPAGSGLAALYLLARLAPATGGAIGGGAPVWASTLMAISVLTVLVAGLSALGRRGIAGIAEAVLTVQMALAFWLAGMGHTGAMAFLVMAMVPAAAALFLCAGLIRRETGSLRLAVPGGLINRMPLTALIAAFALIALAGIAPFAGWHALTTSFAAFGANGLPAAADLSVLAGVATVLAGYALIFAALLHSADLARADAVFPAADSHAVIQDPRPGLLLAPAALVLLVALSGLFPTLPARLAAHTGFAAGGEWAAFAGELPQTPAQALGLWPASTDIIPWLWLGSVGLGFLIHGLRRRAPRPASED
ncbi:proton-conducting transporter transmembrane domain-containing protein [Pseudogemmobacter bohemicus]|uniref:proton-conducting transporter transmembrane domain-containing protein n=1 Tax=Pseudogemmobacter bohemicus TaxID=2250708 RepID=UPI000DD3359C|nr:proton-conducting transporter membrane subunit [Pseudogemmobacter bohemicus]